MSEKPKIAYFGSDPICLPCLHYLVGEGSKICRLSCIVSQPDRRAGRGKRLRQNAVAAFASEHRVELLQPAKPDGVFASRLSGMGLSLALVMAYGHFLGKELRDAPAYGMLNFHGSLLPAYRGASPVETAIAMGERETGVCLMGVAREMDAGPVADCERVCIEKSDTAIDVRSKVGRAVVPLLHRNLSAAVSGELKMKAQNHAEASFCRKITKEDGALDFNQPAAEIECRLRAFTPWPGGYFDHGPNRIRIGSARVLVQAAWAEPGTVVAAGKTLDVATSKGVLQIGALQRPGGKMLAAGEFLRGYPIRVGTLLPSVPAVSLLSGRRE